MFNLFHWLMDHGAASESQNKKRCSEYQPTVNFPGFYCCQGPAKVSFDPDCHISSVKAWISTSKKVISIWKRHHHHGSWAENPKVSNANLIICFHNPRSCAILVKLYRSSLH